MKKLFVLSAVVIVAVSVNAQNSKSMVKNEINAEKHQLAEIKKEKKEDRQELRKLEGNDVSFLSKKAFYEDFGNIPVTEWERKEYFDIAVFTKDNQVMTAFYDDEAKLVGTLTDKTFADLPQSARDYINEKYAAYGKGSVIFFDDNELNLTDMILYGTQFEDTDNYFVELQKDKKKIIVRVDMNGNVTYFTDEK